MVQKKGCFQRWVLVSEKGAAGVEKKVRLESAVWGNKMVKSVPNKSLLGLVALRLLFKKEVPSDLKTAH